MLETDQKLREYLLGTPDPSSERTIEEQFLTGDSEFERLQYVEDELIDDYVFGQLSSDEQARFEYHFLCTSERKQKVEFSRAMRIYACTQTQGESSPFNWSPGSARLPRFLSYGWAAGLLVAVFAFTWVAVENHVLRKELSFLQETRNASDTSGRGTTSNPALPSVQTNALAQPGVSSATGESSRQIKIDAVAMVLTPGSTRGVGAEPRLELSSATQTVQIILRIAPIPKGELRVQLLKVDGERMWSQEMAASRADFDHQGVNIILPAGLLRPDDYRVILSQQLRSGAFEVIAQYTFRVKQLEPR
jgi:hypothetical protein